MPSPNSVAVAPKVRHQRFVKTTEKPWTKTPTSTIGWFSRTFRNSPRSWTMSRVS